MVKEPVHLSDWIEFLNRKVDRNNTLFIASVAVLVALITLFIAVWSFQVSVYSTEIELVALSHSTNTSIDIKNITDFIYWLDVLKYTILGVIGFQIGIAFYIPNMPQVKKARKLLNEIMRNPKDIEIDEIIKEWYRKDENMIDVIRKYVPKGYNLLSLVTVIIGLIFFWIAFYISIINSNNMNDTVISAMSLILTIAVGFVSIGISFFAIGLSQKSDEKMKSIANVEFLKVVNMIEDARIYFIAGVYRVDTYTWKTRNNIEMAIELIKRDKENNYIESKYMDKLWNYFIISFNHFFKYPNWQKEKVSMNHLAESYAMLEEYYDSKHITEFNAYVNENFKNKKDKKIKNEFLALIQAAKTRLSV